MNNSFQVKKEGSSSNDSMESLNLTMQRMELNVLKVVGTLSERVNTMENKIDNLIFNINNLERNTSNTLATTVNGLATHLEKAHAANYEKQISHLAEVQTLSQIITALRQNPNAFGPVAGGPLPVMQMQQQQQHPQHQQQQQATFRPVHPNLQAAPSIPQNTQPPQHFPVEPKPANLPTDIRPAQVSTEPKILPITKPPAVVPEASEKPSPFATNSGSFNFAQGQTQKPLFPAKPALPTAATNFAQSAETKNIFGPTAAAKSTFSFANSGSTTSPFAAPPSTPGQTAPTGNQQKSIFGSPFANAGNSPLSFTPVNSGNTPATANKPSTPAGQQEEHGENENPEEYVPDAHYEPVVPLPDKVDVVTGEESEQVLFKNRCKLYIFNSETKEVKERGVGDIKVLYNPEKKSYRVVMRREQVHKICANFRITKGMNIADKTGSKNCGIFNCVDFTDNNETGTPTVFIIRFRDDTIYDEYKKLFNDISEGRRNEGVPVQDAPKPAPPVAEVKKESETKKEGFGDKFVKKEGEWDCQICYVRNKPSDDACVSCGTGKDGNEKTTSASTFKPTTFSSANTSFSFGLNSAQKPLFGTTTTAAAPSPAKTEAQPTDTKPAEQKSLFGGKPITFSFAPPQPAVTTSPFAPKSNASAFGGTKPAGTDAQPKSLFGGSASSGAANKTPLSFSSFASGTSFLDKKAADSPNKSFGAQTSSTFANKDKDADAQEENENPEEYVPDAHYEPVVPLPDKVDVVTGEESEQVLFKNRCKLYIFNSETKEVKERGVGDIKALYNPEKKSYRVVMRREQVHKICANFRITKGMTIADKTGTKGCGIFSCMDFTENPQNGISTVFYARFREENVYEEFKKLFNEIADGKHVPSTTATSDAAESTSKSVTTINPPKTTTATVPTLPYIGESHNPSVDEADEGEEDYDEDYGEENYDEETEVLLESDCKLTLGEAYKSPLRKNGNDEVYENVKLVVSVADEGVYKVEFDNGKDEPIFPHYIQNDSDYKKDGKKITFIARDHSAVRKSVTCEFKDAATAQKTFETLQECRESTAFDGFED